MRHETGVHVRPPRTAIKVGIFEYALRLTPEVARVYAEQAMQQQQNDVNPLNAISDQGGSDAK